MIQAISNNTALYQAKAAAGSSSGKFVGYILYDKKDTNKDGIVSYAEELDWAIKHPGEDVFGKALSSIQAADGNTTYTQSGVLSPGVETGKGQINLYI